MSIYNKILEIETSGQRAALCTVINTKGSTPRKEGAKMLVLKNGKIYGTIGGGSLEKEVISNALEVINKKKPAIFAHALVHDHGMCCGGTVQIFIEPVLSKKQLYIFGAGHIGKALSGFAQQLDFGVSLVDEREDAFDEWDHPAVKMINKNHNRAYEELKFDENTFIVVVTHDHAYDREIVAYCAKKPYAYLGMIGSHRKVEIAKKTFLAGNILTEKEMNNIDWPMGIEIAVDTPGEIAISILAKMIDVRNTLNIG